MRKLITLVTIAILTTGGVAAACQPKQVDLCPNIDGVQTVIPEGKELNSDKQCVDKVVEVPVTPVDTPIVPTPVVTPVAAPVVQVMPPQIKFGK